MSSCTNQNPKTNILLDLQNQIAFNEHSYYIGLKCDPKIWKRMYKPANMEDQTTNFAAWHHAFLMGP